MLEWGTDEGDEGGVGGVHADEVVVVHVTEVVTTTLLIIFQAINTPNTINNNLSERGGRE